MGNKIVFTESILKRFLPKIDTSGECWIWKAALVYGYGKFRVGQTMEMAHRVSYQLFKGEISDGLHLDHLCRTPDCVNPAHLEPVTCRENLMRGHNTLPLLNSQKTHCPLGHDYSPRGNGSRWCKTCNRDQKQRRQEALLLSS